ncbi:MAG TPA: alpha/beta hydrolase [Chloroflexi bacterium]|nr:alpha/beta hydrolase [Chloroflexota bacterium]HPO58754.1 alpha/beta hydrolase [Anaerolineaceae bacterium]
MLKAALQEWGRTCINQISIVDPYPDRPKPVLLIHGLGSEGTHWGFQFGALAQAGFRPLAPDLPGFGQSPFTGSAWRLEEVTGELAASMRGLGCASLPVVGISMGGVIAQRLALAEPELVERLVLVNTFACLRPKRIRETVYLLSRLGLASLSGPQAQASLVARRLFPQEEQEELRQLIIEEIVNANRLVYRSAMWQLALLDLRSRLREISMPVLVITGERDSTVPVENQSELARSIPGAQHVVIPDAGHAVVVDQVERFNRVLLEFLCQ